MDEVLKQITALRADLKEEFKSGLASVESKLGENTSSLHSINSWRSGVDSQVSDLTASLEAVRKQVDRVVVSVGLSALGAPPGVAATPRPRRQTRAQSHGSWAPGNSATASSTSPGERQRDM
jgi:hypothetical protein